MTNQGQEGSQHQGKDWEAPYIKESAQEKLSAMLQVTARGRGRQGWVTHDGCCYGDSMVRCPRFNQSPCPHIVFHNIPPHFQAMEDWLYEEGEDTTKSVYIAKLEELKKTGGCGKSAGSVAAAHVHALYSFHHLPCLGIPG